MKRDISNQTVVILAILTIIMSVVSVTTIFYETSKTTMVREDVTETTAKGMITLRIPEEPLQHLTEGKISIKVQETP